MIIHYGHRTFDVPDEQASNWELAKRLDREQDTLIAADSFGAAERVNSRYCRVLDRIRASLSTDQQDAFDSATIVASVKQ